MGALAVNIVIALLFGLGHLFVADSVTQGKLITIVLATAVPGAIWGWLYWRLRLVQAMLSHMLHDCIGYILVTILISSIAN
jgi:membrane protease YdiL (CAAX protease family)